MAGSEQPERWAQTFWKSERREFAVRAREDSLDAREAHADRREAEADEREAQADERLSQVGLLDDAAATDRRKAREERERLRAQRETDRAQRTDEHQTQDKQARQRDPGSDFPLAAQFAELATALFAAGSVGDVLDHLVVAAARITDSADAVSVTLRHNGTYSTPAYHGELAYHLDQLQYQHAEGPCVDAASVAGTAYSACSDLAGESPWPAFARAAAEAGGRSVLGFGMFPDPDASLPRLGSLNFYSRTPAAFDDDTAQIGTLFAAHAGVALASTSALSQAELRQEHLRQAMHSHDVIGQAKGILMERRKLTPEQAFDVLRDASNRLNTKLADLARHLADTGEAPPTRR